MSVNIRSLLYFVAKLMGDVNAVKGRTDGESEFLSSLVSVVTFLLPG